MATLVLRNFKVYLVFEDLKKRKKVWWNGNWSRFISFDLQKCIFCHIIFLILIKKFTLTNSPFNDLYFRKFYFLDPEESVGNPDETFITVPNIPLITALSSARVNIKLLNKLHSIMASKPINIRWIKTGWNNYTDNFPRIRNRLVNIH